MSAEVEAVRRQEAVIKLRQKLAEAREAQMKGEYQNASQLYEQAYAHVLVLGPDLIPEGQQVIDGLVAVRLQLAKQAQNSRDLRTAKIHIDRAFKVAPRDEVVIAFKRANDAMIAEQRGSVPSQEMQARVPDWQEEQLNVQTHVQDGILLYKYGKYEQAEEVLRQAVLDDPNNLAAFHYLNLVKEAMNDQEMKKREESTKTAMVSVSKAWNPPETGDQLPQPNPYARSRLINTSPSRQRIMDKLDRFVLPEVQFEGLPLGEVIRILDEMAVTIDPDNEGLNFIVNSYIDAPTAPQATFIDPATGESMQLPPPEPINLKDEVIVYLTPALKNVRLADVLDAVIKVADRPIKYSIEDYAIIFTQKTPEPIQLFSRTFKVDPNTF
ncbi:MAG TPA: hypothetical protein VMS21_16095, partial [Methylomirabilota bacterium]|nr:hypothetical protein [Methylomirabilota bacterium]